MRTLRLVANAAQPHALNIALNWDPKSYGLRLVIDENNNGKWDTGNYLQKRQAEKIILYPQKVNVRSNWDVEVEWEVK